jgi:hypothetical protein
MEQGLLRILRDGHGSSGLDRRGGSGPFGVGSGEDFEPTGRQSVRDPWVPGSRARRGLESPHIVDGFGRPRQTVLGAGVDNRGRRRTRIRPGSGVPLSDTSGRSATEDIARVRDRRKPGKAEEKQDTEKLET